MSSSCVDGDPFIFINLDHVLLRNFFAFAIHGEILNVVSSMY